MRTLPSLNKGCYKQCRINVFQFKGVVSCLRCTKFTFKLKETSRRLKRNLWDNGDTDIALNLFPRGSHNTENTLALRPQVKYPGCQRLFLLGFRFQISIGANLVWREEERSWERGCIGAATDATRARKSLWYPG